MFSHCNIFVNFFEFDRDDLLIHFWINWGNFSSKCGILALNNLIFIFFFTSSHACCDRLGDEIPIKLAQKESVQKQDEVAVCIASHILEFALWIEVRLLQIPSGGPLCWGVAAFKIKERNWCGMRLIGVYLDPRSTFLVLEWLRSGSIDELALNDYPSLVFGLDLGRGSLPFVPSSLR